MAKAKTEDSINDSEWQKIEKRLSECMAKEAKSYLLSGDAFLDQRADHETPRILAERFLKACGALE